MGNIKIIFISALLFFSGSCNEKKAKNSATLPQEKISNPTIGTIERLDPQLDLIISPDAKIEVLGEGFVWSEGPLWIEDGNFLIFSDVPQNTIFKWKEGEGISEYLNPSGYTGEGKYSNEPGSNGLALSPDSKLVLCQHGDRRIAVMDAPLNKPEPKYSTVTDQYDGKKFNSPNDLVFHPNGDVYFTDPPYGLPLQADDSSREIDIQGVYKSNTEGTTTLLTDELSRPNGLAFSPDHSTLYVTNSDPDYPVIMAYEVNTDGLLQNGRVFFNTSPLMAAGGKGLPDGIKVNDQGIIFSTGPGGVLIFTPEGKHLGTISSGEATANCAIGNGGKYLYATSDMYLIRVPLL